MFKRKRKSSEYDDDFLYPLPSEYGETGDVTLKKPKQGCVFILLGVVLLLVCSFIGYKAYQRSVALRPIPTLTYPADDGVPIQVDSGLAFAEYAVNGQQTGIYDLDGQSITSDTLPVSLPVSAAENLLDGLNAIAYPEGAFYDVASGQLVVFGPSVQGDSSTSRDDFLTTLRAVYAGEYPGVSIDPADSETVQNVRYIGQTENTHFGWVMFEADRRMKTLSMGQDNVTGASVTSSVPGFANMFDLELQLGGQNQNEVRRRFWFKVPSVVIEQTPDGQGMSITALSLSVDTEYLDADWQTSSSQPPDPAGQAFAAHLTNHYDEYTADFPVFNELKAVARWTALAHWLRQADLPIQPELWLINSSSPYNDAPLTTPAITVTHQSEQGNIIQTLMLWGGVSLEMTPEIRPAQEATLGRLQEVTNSFKAWTGTARLESGGQGISYTPLASSEIKQAVTSTIEIPLPLAPAIQHTPEGWSLRVPHLKHEGTTFLFDDPSRSQPLVLSYHGSDADTNVDVFADTEHGLRLAMYEDGYQLMFGEFDANEKFSYYENDYMFFDLQGNILNDRKTGASYIYRDGVLINIQQNGGDLRISFNREGKIKQLKSVDGEVNLVYDNGLLMDVNDASGQSIRKFTYDERNRLVREIGANGNVEKVFRYDDQDRILYQIEKGKPFLYDWHENNTLTRISGDALLPWQDAKINELMDLNVMLRLRRGGIVDQMLFTRQLGDKLVVMVNDQSYMLPTYMIQNPSALRGKLAPVLAREQPGQVVLISDYGVQGVAFQSLFKNSIPLTAKTMDEARITANLELLLKTPQGFYSHNASVINAVPKPDEAGTVDSSPGLWYVESGNEASQTWNALFDSLITQPDIAIPSRPATNEQVGTALSKDLSVFIVVAHSDGKDIYLPNGVKFNPEQLSTEEKAQIAQKKPFIILLSCDTAAPLGEDSSFAQKLLEVGPRVVIAPNGKLKVSDAYDVLKYFLEDPLSKTDALKAFLKAIKEVYPDYHSFEFHVQIIPPRSQESYT